ncbi:hypothetical protein TNCV_4293541 [Trichonephila clavipes]|uniref:Uncharacterized protein n=1 Tax=Trichonephila clavipes TaxID=2585209 RepID=A0A8X6RKL5_TRICX|nr:hypothetical protein TNCV_4293541 [Trichonephila clavipes]
MTALRVPDVTGPSLRRRANGNDAKKEGVVDTPSEKLERSQPEINVFVRNGVVRFLNAAAGGDVRALMHAITDDKLLLLKTADEKFSRPNSTPFSLPPL